MIPGSLQDLSGSSDFICNSKIQAICFFTFSYHSTLLSIKYICTFYYKFVMCPFFLLLCLMFIVENQTDQKPMRMSCSTCHRKAIRFSHVHTVLETERGDTGAERTVTRHPVTHISPSAQSPSTALRRPLSAWTVQPCFGA